MARIVRSAAGVLARDHLRLLIVFGVLAATLLVMTAAIRMSDSFSEYAEVQERYNRLAAAQGRPAIRIRIDQIWAPDAGIADRCGSCHLAAAGSPSLSGDPLFAAHPPTPHDPSTFGCTPCHGGYGRAVSRRAAHRDGSGHAAPLLPMAYVEANCGVCHTGIAVRDRRSVERGRSVFSTAHCDRCHGAGAHEGKTADLRYAGSRGYSRDWHLADGSAALDDTRAASDHTSNADIELLTLAAHLNDTERADVDAFLDTRVGAPTLVEGKALFFELGCPACHRAGGVGGTLARDLSDIGSVALDPDQFPDQAGARRRADWLRSVLLAPEESAPDTLMRRVELDEDETSALVTYMLSLRPGPAAVTGWPNDRLRVERLGQREFDVDGESLFNSFCSGCHGAQGRGMRLGDGTKLAVPTIGGATFLDVASDSLIESTIRSGRADSAMPAWADPVSGLRDTEIAAIVHYLRGLAPAPIELARFRETIPDLTSGLALFQGECAPCHGAAGEGSAVAPPLGATDNPVSRSPAAVYGTLMFGIQGTAMGAFRGLDVGQVRALAAAVGVLPVAPTSREGWRQRAGDPAVGQRIFRRVCVSCHADDASPLRAPRILSPDFLTSVDDNFLTACVARRHHDLPDLAESGLDVSAEDIADVVAYLRSRAPQP